MKKDGPIIRKMIGALVSLAMAFAAVLAAAPGAGAVETGAKHLEEARLAVENAPLTRQEKLGILAAADRSVQAGIPAEDTAIIVTRGLRRGVAGSNIEGFLDTAARVKQEGLPVRLILDRTEQGLSKGVPPERIAAVVGGLADKLAAARPLVNALVQGGVKPSHGGSPDQAIETVARALERSVPEDAIRRTGEMVRDRKGSIALLDRAVNSMTTLAGSGMSADQAARLVHTAVGKGYSERDFGSMERYTVNELRSGRRMSDIVSSMETRMERGEMWERERMNNQQMRGPASGMGGGPGAGSGAEPGMGRGMGGPRR